MKCCWGDFAGCLGVFRGRNNNSIFYNWNERLESGENDESIEGEQLNSIGNRGNRKMMRKKRGKIKKREMNKKTKSRNDKGFCISLKINYSIVITYSVQ